MSPYTKVLHAALSALLLINQVHAFCFYNQGSSSIWVIGSGRVYNNDMQLQVRRNGESFMQMIAPGAKSCWYNGGQSGPCAVETFYVTFSWGLTEAAGSIDYVINPTYYEKINFLSGDAVVTNIDNAWQFLRYPNPTCGPEPSLD
jgi:hypothetical protein